MRVRPNAIASNKPQTVTNARRKRFAIPDNDAPRSIAQYKGELLDIVQNELLPCYNTRTYGFIELGSPPVQSFGKISTTDHLLDTQCDGGIDIAPTLAADGMKPLRFPRIAFVIDGEADLRVGVTENLRRHNAGLSPTLTHQTISIPAGHAIVFPSGVPLDTASFPHWFRPEPESAASRIFWLVVLPEGMLVHSCVTAGASHERSAELFAKSAYLHVQTEHLIHELRQRQLRHELVAHNCLVTILSMVERALVAERVYFHPNESPLSDTEAEARAEALPPKQDAYRRACAYIEAHVHERLTAQLIARQAAVSPTHLNRLFRDQSGISVMRHVAAHRVSVARLLLRETQLPISEVATIVGLPDHAIFNRTFKRGAGLSPSTYRLQINRNG